MAIQTKPNIQIPWAETGNKTSVSEAKVRQGWIAEIPPAEVENFYQNRQETGLMHIFQTGISQWDALTPYTAFKSYVQASDGNIYLAVNDNTGQNPLTTTNWRLLIDKSSKLVNETRSINTGTGLQGGGNLTTDRTISLSLSGVNTGEYGSSGSVPRISVDSTGRITVANNQAIDFNTPITSALSDRSLTNPGFQNFPGGLKIKWGTVLSGGSYQKHFYATPFPTATLSIALTVANSTSQIYSVMQNSSASDGFLYAVSSGNAFVSGILSNYIAIGY